MEMKFLSFCQKKYKFCSVYSDKWFKNNIKKCFTLNLYKSIDEKEGNLYTFSSFIFKINEQSYINELFWMVSDGLNGLRTPGKKKKENKWDMNITLLLSCLKKNVNSKYLNWDKKWLKVTKLRLNVAQNVHIKTKSSPEWWN